MHRLISLALSLSLACCRNAQTSNIFLILTIFFTSFRHTLPRALPFLCAFYFPLKKGKRNDAYFSGSFWKCEKITQSFIVLRFLLILRLFSSFLADFNFSYFTAFPTADCLCVQSFKILSAALNAIHVKRQKKPAIFHFIKARTSYALRSGNFCAECIVKSP